MNYTPTQANIAWNKLRLVITELSKKKAEELNNRIRKGCLGVVHGEQLELL